MYEAHSLELSLEKNKLYFILLFGLIDEEGNKLLLFFPVLK